MEQTDTTITNLDLTQYGVKKIASGKVRELYEIDSDTLLFVATDRISAYDVILANVTRPLLPCRQPLYIHLHSSRASPAKAPS